MKFGQRSLIAALAVVAVVVSTRVAIGGSSPQQAAITVVPYHASDIYKLGEVAGWKVGLLGGSPTPGKMTYTIKTNNNVVIKSGDIDFSAGPVKVETMLNEPAMLYMQLSPVTLSPQKAYGAAIDPTGLKPVAPKPADFDSFWNRKIKELHAVPENAVVTPGASYKPEVEYSLVTMDHVNGTKVYAQMAKPKKAGKFPAILVMQWASPPYRLDPSWVIELAAKGYLVLDIQPHNARVDGDPAYYAGLPAEMRIYGSTEQQNLEKNYFVEMYQRDYRGVDYLTESPYWDGKTLIVTGTSMGGQQSLVVAGLHPKVTHLMVNEPAGCDMTAGINGRQQGYPFYPANDPKAMAVAPYIDPINFSYNNHAMSLVGMGFVDDVAPPTGIYTAFNLIKGPKEAAPMIASPHNNMATPDQQKPITSRMNAWFDAIARGENPMKSSS